MILVNYRNSKQNQNSSRTPKFRNPSFSPFLLPKTSNISAVVRMRLACRRRRMPEAKMQVWERCGEEGRLSDIQQGIY